MKLTKYEAKLLDSCARNCSLGLWCTATLGMLRTARRLHKRGLLVDMYPDVGGDGRRIFRASAKGNKFLVLIKEKEGK